jgi:hypothetical protein
MSEPVKPGAFEFAALAAYGRRRDSTGPDHDPVKAQRIFDRYEPQILACIEWMVRDEHERYLEDVRAWFGERRGSSVT